MTLLNPVVLLVILASVLAAADAKSTDVLPARSEIWGPSAHGLRIGISGSPEADAGTSMVFEVLLQNTGTDDFVVNLGYMLANGKVMFPSAVRLLLSDSAGTVRELEYSDRRYPGVAGRVDDFIVALRAGSTHALRISLDQMWSPVTREFEVKLTPGRYRMRARFEGKGATTTNSDMPGVARLHFWKGAVQSGAVDFEVRQR